MVGEAAHPVSNPRYQVTRYSLRQKFGATHDTAARKLRLDVPLSRCSEAVAFSLHWKHFGDIVTQSIGSVKGRNLFPVEKPSKMTKQEAKLR